ncbi:hypothetical protein [Myxococcus vastator]|uniref:hypothetical protein n=1 Tax=Myxococcus vastator TaxID=2709664 RepID=UPI0013D27745|nr:hypothetical protein [Myxococcus vastator]
MTNKHFPEQLALSDLQPWISTRPLDGQLAEKRRTEREALLHALADSRLATIEQKVCRMLRDYPETRDSDTALLIRYWRKFQADTLLDWSPLQLEALFELEKVESISRARRHIQNDLNLFQATPRILALRGDLQMEFNQYLATRREGDPEIRFYLDETGNEPQDRFTGVAGICVLDWRQFEMQHIALTRWREKQGWPETLHFNKLTEDPAPYLALLSQLQRRRAGILFSGYALPARRNKQEMVFSLISQLLTDSIRHAEQLGCLNTCRAVTVIKEREDGFDNLFLQELKTSLNTHFAREFPGKAYLKEIIPLPKGREVLLECADIIASGMRRRALNGGRHSKDRVADAVMNVTGFEDHRDKGALFKYFAPR